MFYELQFPFSFFNYSLTRKRGDTNYIYHLIWKRWQCCLDSFFSLCFSWCCKSSVGSSKNRRWLQIYTRQYFLHISARGGRTKQENKDYKEDIHTNAESNCIILSSEVLRRSVKIVNFIMPSLNEGLCHSKSYQVFEKRDDKRTWKPTHKRENFLRRKKVCTQTKQASSRV